MILISAVLHVIIILCIISTSFRFAPQPRAVAYTVELVNPAVLGTNLPGGGKKGIRTEAESPALPKPSSQPKQEGKLQSQVAKKEEPKLPPPAPRKGAVAIPEKAKSVEKSPVKAEPEKPKMEEGKTEPTAALPKIAKKEEPKREARPTVVKPEPPLTKEESRAEPKPEKMKKIEEKKSEPQKTATKPLQTEVNQERKEPKPQSAEPKPEMVKPSVNTVERNSEEKPATTDVVSAEERDRQIAAALERIKTQVQPKGNPELTEEAKGTGPLSKGGSIGEGGGGVTRGVEFILYTQQLQRRVQESWIVAEKKPGLVASVSFKIQPDGDIQEVELTHSSGDSAFDQSVVRAIRKAAPFPPPPQSYAQEFTTQKIFMHFGGEGRVN